MTNLDPSRRLRQRLEDYKQFFQSIQQGAKENVGKFIEFYPKSKFVFNSHHESALTIALKSDQLDMYEYLIAKGFWMGEHEKFDKIVGELTSQISLSEAVGKKRRLREIHQKYVVEPSLKHLHILKSKSKLSHDTDDENKTIYEDLIAKAFESLSKILWVKPILKIAANSYKLQLIFDFNRVSVEVMDPTKNRNIYGTTSLKHSRIFVGAKNLRNDQKRFGVYGSLVHELCHFVMNMLYKNDCKPYREIEGLKIFEFNKVVATCKLNKEKEEIIMRAYNCPQSKWHAELIVRGDLTLSLKQGFGAGVFFDMPIAGAFYFLYPETLL